MAITRRQFLGAAAGAGAFGALDVLLDVAPASAREAAMTPDIVRFSPDIEPLVRLIEDTPRSRCIEVMAEQVRKGVTYQQFLAALFLAGIRNVNPQPPGFKFHCVFLAHSANYLAQTAPPEEKLLPLFWVLDVFKKSQEEDASMGDFVLRPVQGELPSGQRAWDEFHAAMMDWDEPRADRAVTALAREAEPGRVFEALWEYGARDYRNIGHKAIFVANAWRTLDTIGWRHAEPTLRSLVLGLLDFGKSNVVNNYAFEDQSYFHNRELVAKFADNLPGDWTEPGANEGATLALLAPMREGKLDAASDLAVQLLAEGKCRAGAVWDAVYLAAGELMMRQPGIAGVHTVTSANGLHFGFRASGDPRTRLLMLLQGIGWMGQFRNFMDTRRDRSDRITDIYPAEVPGDTAAAAEAILATISDNRNLALRQAYAYAQADPGAATFFDGARRLVFLKSTEHHHFKWPAAIFEDYRLVSPSWRPHLLATSVLYLRGAAHEDSPVVLRALDVLKTA